MNTYKLNLTSEVLLDLIGDRCELMCRVDDALLLAENYQFLLSLVKVLNEVRYKKIIESSFDDSLPFE